MFAPVMVYIVMAYIYSMASRCRLRMVAILHGGCTVWCGYMASFECTVPPKQVQVKAHNIPAHVEDLCRLKVPKTWPVETFGPSIRSKPSAFAVGVRRKEAKNMRLECAVRSEQVGVKAESVEPEHSVAQTELRRVVRCGQVELAVCVQTRMQTCAHTCLQTRTQTCAQACAQAYVTVVCADARQVRGTGGQRGANLSRISLVRCQCSLLNDFGPPGHPRGPFCFFGAC